ncbi:epidermal growth factor receptor-like, partial [Mercenaria mercenaria]|uniref:epidermal growth factor receptor-like n=1 Tax=Mercenaria mercenaria TaxID=6596 RepID=UPI00234F62F3
MARWMCRCFWIVTVVCLVAVHCSLADAQNGTYNSSCTVNSDCQVGSGLVCLQEECTCDYSYFYDKKELRCKKVCKGTPEGLAENRGYDYHYVVYKELFTNCSYVNGNLKITDLDGSFNLGFLKDIEEIYGYLYVSNVNSSYLNLTKMRIVRGNEMYEMMGTHFSILISRSKLLELQFKRLTEITKGNVWFWRNDLLCFVDTINWKDTAPNSFLDTCQNNVLQCPPCQENCYKNATQSGQCWGSSPDMCQNLNYIKEVCVEECGGRRCFESDKNICCHAECAAGCTGPLNTDCLACRNFYNDDGTCRASCPDGRYTLGSLCVKVCPDYMEKKNGACVIQCPEGKYFNTTTNMCRKCNGPCFK